VAAAVLTLDSVAAGVEAEAAKANALLGSDLASASPVRREAFTGVPPSEATRWVYTRMLEVAVRADREAGWGLLGEGGGKGAAMTAIAADNLIYDRFGPAFSDVQFRWHCDALPADPCRKVSVVAYFTDPAAYAGGTLEMKVAGEVGGQAVGDQSRLCDVTGVVGEAGLGEEARLAGLSPALNESRNRESASVLAADGTAVEQSCVVHRRYAPGWAVAFPSTSLEHRVCPVQSGERRSLLLIVGRKKS
jgi:hypothetical protein